MAELVCRSCPSKYPMPARYIASAKHHDGTSTDWPCCTEHMQYAMVAGWFPINEIPTPSSQDTDQ